MEPTNGTNKQLLQGLWRRSNCNAEENKGNSILKCRNAFKKEKNVWKFVWQNHPHNHD